MPVLGWPEFQVVGFVGSSAVLVWMGCRALHCRMFPPPAKIEIAPARESPPLEIQYDMNKHYTKYRNGSVQVRVTIKNSGAEPVKLNVVKVVGIVPRLNIGEVSDMSTQYHSMPLKLVRRKIGDFIAPEDNAEALVVHSDKGDSHFLFDTDEVEGPYRLSTSSQYEVEILASGDGCQPDKKFFLLRQVDGILRFDRCDPVVSYPAAAPI